MSPGKEGRDNRKCTRGDSNGVDWEIDWRLSRKDPGPSSQSFVHQRYVTYPGGLMPWEVLEALALLARHPNCRALLIVQLNPAADSTGMSVKLAAEMVMHFLAGVALRD